MADSDEEQAFNEQLMARVKEWREAKRLTAAEMAHALGIPPARYRKYEYRTPLPGYLWERFCIVNDATLEELISGKRTKKRA